MIGPVLWSILIWNIHINGKTSKSSSDYGYVFCTWHFRSLPAFFPSLQFGIRYKTRVTWKVCWIISRSWKFVLDQQNKFTMKFERVRTKFRHLGTITAESFNTNRVKSALIGRKAVIPLSMIFFLILQHFYSTIHHYCDRDEPHQVVMLLLHYVIMYSSRHVLGIRTNTYSIRKC